MSKEINADSLIKSVREGVDPDKVVAEADLHPQKMSLKQLQDLIPTGELNKVKNLLQDKKILVKSIDGKTTYRVYCDEPGMTYTVGVAS